MVNRQQGHRALAVAVAVALVTGGAVAILTGRIALASSNPCTPGTTVYETAASGFTFVCRGYSDEPLDTPLTVSFFDSDSVTHTFTIINRSNVSIPDPSSQSTGHLGSLVKTYGTLVNVTATQGVTVTAPLAKITKAGWYEFVCMEPDHFQEGMWGFIAFGVDLPANISFASGAPGPGIAVFIIIGTVVSLTVLAIVLGFVVGKRQGAEHEMPPERLGYPEPSEPPAAAPLPPKPPR